MLYQVPGTWYVVPGINFTAVRYKVDKIRKFWVALGFFFYFMEFGETTRSLCCCCAAAVLCRAVIPSEELLSSIFGDVDVLLFVLMLNELPYL